MSIAVEEITKEEIPEISTNKGKAKACPECKKMLLMVVSLLGEGVDIKMKCAYCKKRILVNIGQKTFITATKIAVLIFLVVSAVQAFSLMKLNLNVAYIFTNYNLPLPNDQ